MNSMFRIYAKTSKPNDKYLFNQLVSYGLKPTYQQLLHSYYFNATFSQIFKLSFESYTAQSLYLQLGHRYALSTEMGENEKSVTDFLRKINFRNYFALDRGIVENITMKLVVRESSMHLPSENAIVSLFQNYLQREVVMKEYRKMGINADLNRLDNYYDIKQIVERKWQHQDYLKQQSTNNLLTQNNQLVTENNQLVSQDAQNTQLPNNIQHSRKHQSPSDSISSRFQVPYAPHFIMYVRRNHARLLLKINKQSMHKHGWKKNVGWGPIRESLAASILYRTGLVPYAKEHGITLWDPLCGSGTFALVALSMLKNLKVRQNELQNFIWHKWPVYKPQYLSQYIDQSHKQSQKNNIRIFCSDIDPKSTQNTINNFRQFLSQNQEISGSSEQGGPQFLKISPIDRIYKIISNKIYIGSGDFCQFPPHILHNKSQKTTILTNLPYLGQRSKQHHPIKQLVSIYRRFGEMVDLYSEYIENVFVLVDADISNSNHFLTVAKGDWRVLEYFSNGGIEVCLVGWKGNAVGWRELEVYDHKDNKAAIAYDEEKHNNLLEYRKSIQQIEEKQYKLPAHLGKKSGLRQNKRVMEKKRVRHLQAAFELFAKRRDKRQLFESYARKNLALRLSQRGKTWKRKNISVVGSDILGKQELIKKEFESRIEEAVRRSEEMKEKKKSRNQRVKRKW